MGTISTEFREAIGKATTALIAELKAEAARQRAAKVEAAADTPGQPFYVKDTDEGWVVCRFADGEPVFGPSRNRMLIDSVCANCNRSAGLRGEGPKGAPERETTPANSGEAPVSVNDLRVWMDKTARDIREHVHRDLSASETAMIERLEKQAAAHREYADSNRKKIDAAIDAMGARISAIHDDAIDLVRRAVETTETVRTVLESHDARITALANDVQAQTATLGSQVQINANVSKSLRNVTEAISVMREELDGFADRDAGEHPEIVKQIASLQDAVRELRRGEGFEADDGADTLPDKIGRLVFEASAARETVADLGARLTTAIENGNGWRAEFERAGAAMRDRIDAIERQYAAEHDTPAQFAARIAAMIQEAGGAAEIHVHNTAPEPEPFDSDIQH